MSTTAPYKALADEQIRVVWMAEFGDRPHADRAFDRLVATYRGPLRYYHTIEHGMEVAASARLLSADLSNEERDTVGLAAWCHDACFDYRAPDNEARSAAFAIDLAGLLGFTPERAAQLHDVVLASRHTLEPASQLAKVMCDADLAVLAKPWPDYCNDVANIRAESGIAEPDEWRTMRLKMLSFFENKRPLYHLDQATSAWQDLAVANREHETDLLLAS